MNKKIKVAILAGGDSEERVISEMSAGVVNKFLDKSTYDARIIDIRGASWRDAASDTEADKNNFSFSIAGEPWRPDVIFCAIHGSPMENGVIQGYFEILGIPYTCCDGFVSALTMDKYLTKQVLKPAGIPMANEVFITRDNFLKGIDADAIISQLKLPLFVKPNAHGSSFGVRKVKTLEELMPAVEYAFRYDDAILLESFMDGREFGNGVMRYDGRVIVFPPTEIIPENEFFDYEAKYEGKSKEVTPAQISDELTAQLAALTGEIYTFLNCRGFVRIDFILVGDTFHLIEVNTVPGLSEASIIPQQAVAYEWTLTEFFGNAISEAMQSQLKPA